MLPVEGTETSVRRRFMSSNQAPKSRHLFTERREPYTTLDDRVNHGGYVTYVIPILYQSELTI
jgi:hypothetical protein